MIVISNGNVLMATLRAALSLVLLLSKSGIPFGSNHCKKTRQVKTSWISIKDQQRKNSSRRSSSVKF